MTCCLLKSAVRRGLLSAVACVAVGLAGWGGSVALAEEAAAVQTPDALAADPTPAPASEANDAAPAPATVTGLPKDLTVLTRDELIGLVKDLTLQNQMLAVKLAEQQQALADAAPDLQARIDWQARTIERLQAKLTRAQRDADEAAAAPEPVAAEDTHPDAEVAAGQAANGNGNGKWEYRFAYEFGLIRTSGDGHVILRDENGKRQRHEFDYTEYRRDALWVNLLIRNDSKQPMRFTGLIELQGDKPFLSGNRERLATHAFRTPLLQPGEVFQINEDELTVERPWKVDVIELTSVQAFPTPADPDPDPGSR